MTVKFLAKIKSLSGRKTYGLMKGLREMGVEITPQGVAAYERKEARSMRLDVLCGLRQLSGLSWAQFGELIEFEFGAKEKKKDGF